LVQERISWRRKLLRVHSDFLKQRINSGFSEADRSMGSRAGKILDFSVGRKLRTTLRARPCLRRSDERRAYTRTPCRRLDIPPLDECDVIGKATLRMSPYRKLDEAKGLPSVVKCDQHFERLAQLAGKIAVNFFAMLSRG